MSFGPRLIAIAATLALVLVGCGGSSGETGSADPAAELEHIHGLGINPEDGALLIATHHGLFRMAAGENEPSLVGESRQDLMGFSVVGPDDFLASGHPAPGQPGPTSVGLIRSQDGGRSWQSISLAGEADFHVLRSAGRRVYGFNAANARFMASTNGGRTWTEPEPPAAMIDVAIDPTSPTSLVASTERGLYRSSDAGKRWRALDRASIGLLAWSRRGDLYLVEGTGAVRRAVERAQDAPARKWEAVGAIGGQPAAFTAGGQRDLYAALADGAVKKSTDGGKTWSVLVSPAPEPS